MKYEDMTDEDILNLYERVIGPLIDTSEYEAEMTVKECRDCLEAETLPDAVRCLENYGWGEAVTCARALWKEGRWGGKPTYVKTTFTFEVLSEELIPDSWSLEEIYEETVNGGWSGYISDWRTEHISREQLIDECHNQGTEPEFFLEKEGVTEE